MTMRLSSMPRRGSCAIGDAESWGRPRPPTPSPNWIANDRPDLIVADAHLAGQTTGIDAIELLRGAFAAPIPAFVMSGDVSEQLQQDVQKRGYALLHKPVDPMRLRTTLNRLLGRRPAGAEKAGSPGKP